MIARAELSAIFQPVQVVCCYVDSCKGRHVAVLFGKHNRADSVSLVAAEYRIHKNAMYFMS